MKLIAYTDSDYFSGAERVLAEVVAGSPELDWQLIVNPIISERFGQNLPPNQVVKPLASRSKWRLGLMARFWRLLKRESPQLCVVNMQTPFANTYFLWAASMAGVPVVTIWHLPQERKDLTGLLAPLKHLAYRLAIDWSRQIVTVSHWHQRVLVEQFGCPSEKIIVIPNGVKVGSGRRPHKSSVTTLISVGTLEERKGQALLVQAIQGLDADYKLQIIGSGPDETKLKSLIADANLTAKISLEGYQTDPGQYYQQADLLVHSALAENLSMVILDALAYGLPVIAHNVGGNSEMVVPGENGWLVELGSIEGWQRAIGEALKTDLNKYGQASQARYDKFYTLEKMNDGYKQLFKRFK